MRSLPVALLLAVACAQVTLTRTAGLSPWKGGGFGMFSTTDDAGRRHVRVFVSAPERSEEIAITPSLEDAAARAAVLPGDGSSRAWRVGWSSASAGISRPVETVRIEAWRIEYAPDTLAATTRLTRSSSTVWTRLLHPARDDDGVADAVLKLTAIILLLRPFDIWWVAPIRPGRGVPVAARSGRQASADHVDASGGARGGQDRPRLAALGQPHLPPGLLVSGDRAGALGSQLPPRRWRRAVGGSSVPRSRWRSCGRRCCRRTTWTAASSG